MFGPLWNLFAVFFAYFMILEALKKLGLISENKK